MSAATLYLPISGSDECISLSLTSLPSDPRDLSDVLGSELADPELWLASALAYLTADHTNGFEGLLKEFTADEAQNAYADDRYTAGRIKVYNALAAYETRKAALSAAGPQQEQAFNHAIELYNRSAELDPTSTLTWVGKGLLMLVKGQLDDASSAFHSALMADTGKESALARLGLGCILIQKKEYQEALKLYKAALMTNPNLPAACRLGFAICYYQLGDYAQARASYLRVLELSEGENVHALLGLATIEMNEWRDAANQIEIDARKSADSASQAAALQQRMKELQNSPHITKAFDYLQRVHVIDPSHPQALLLYASHFFFTNEYGKSREFAIRVVQGLNATPSLATRETRAIALYYVARTYHAQRNYDEAFQYYTDARALSSNHAPISLGYAQMLVACKGEIENAIEVLEGVINASAKAATGNAAHDAKQMAAAASNNFQVLRILGSLYSMPPSAAAQMLKASAALSKKGDNNKSKDNIISLPDYEKSYVYLKKSVDLHPNSLELLLEFAEVAARLHVYSQSYLSYRRLLKLMLELYKMPKDTLNAELLNNFGVVCQKLGKLEEAQEYYEWSLRNRSTSASGDDNTSSKKIPADKVTTHYNIGLLQESKGSFDAALAKMDAILDEYPSYTDAMLYSGRVLQRSGDFTKAKEFFDKAKTAAESAAAASSSTAVAAAPAIADAAASLPAIHCALGNWYLAQHEVDAAKSCFDAVLTKLNTLPGAKKDDYAKLSLGNLNMLKQQRKIRSIQLALPGVPQDSSTFQAKARDAKVDWKEVAAFYENVLNKDGKNLYAAHGLGCVLAQQGKFFDAKEIFQQIKDISVGVSSGKDAVEALDLPDVWCNLGHIYVQQGSYVSAIKMYSQCLKNFRATSTPSTLNVLTYLARAYYLSDQFMEAKKSLEKALQFDPNNTPLWYNLGLTSEAYAIDIFQKPPAFRSYREVESAIVELNHAFSIFSRLQTTPTSKANASLYGDIADKAGRHAVFCRMSIQNGQPHLAFARQREDEQAKLLEESRLARQKLEEDAEAKRRADEEEKQRTMERLESEAQAKKQYLEEKMKSSEWEIVKSEDTLKKERSAAEAAGTADTNDDLGDMEGEMARRRKKMEKAHKKRSKRDSGSDNDDEDGERKKRKKEKKAKKRSKYEAEGEHAKNDSDDEERKSDAEGAETSNVDVDAELAARRAKMSAQLNPDAAAATAVKSERKRLTKASADSDEEGADAANMDVDEGEAAADADAAAIDEAAGEEDEEEQTRSKKQNKKRRQLIDDDDEEEAEAEYGASAAAAADTPAASEDTPMAE